MKIDGGLVKIEEKSVGKSRLKGISVKIVKTHENSVKIVEVHKNSVIFE